jgi:MYXO-CTERM domain-containing protein
MSRNAWLTDTCPVYKKLRKAANAHFSVTLDKAKLCLSEVRTASDLRLQLTLIRQAWEQLMHSKLTKEQRGTIRDVLAKAPCIPLLDGIIVSPDQLMTRVAGSSFHAHAPYSDSACLFVVTDTRGGLGTDEVVIRATPYDAGQPDAGVPFDAGVASDGGEDGGAGGVDSGVDAGPDTDAGTSDAGPTSDAGASNDAGGTTDGGLDGADAGRGERRSYSLGCGCASDSGALTALLGLLALGRRRRPAAK